MNDNNKSKTSSLTRFLKREVHTQETKQLDSELPLVPLPTMPVNHPINVKKELPIEGLGWYAKMKIGALVYKIQEEAIKIRGSEITEIARINSAGIIEFERAKIDDFKNRIASAFLSIGDTEGAKARYRTVCDLLGTLGEIHDKVRELTEHYDEADDIEKKRVDMSVDALNYEVDTLEKQIKKVQDKMSALLDARREEVGKKKEK